MHAYDHIMRASAHRRVAVAVAVAVAGDVARKSMHTSFLHVMDDYAHLFGTSLGVILSGQHMFACICNIDPPILHVSHSRTHAHFQE